MGIWDLCPSVCVLRMTLQEFLQHSKESRGVLGQGGQGGHQVGLQGGYEEVLHEG